MHLSMILLLNLLNCFFNIFVSFNKFIFSFKQLWHSIKASFSDHVLLWTIVGTWRRHWHPTPVLLPEKSYGRRSLEGCMGSLRVGHDWAASLSLSCTGEGNGNPLQCSCLENPRDGGAWWAAVCGVAQSWTWLKWLSSSSNNEVLQIEIILTWTLLNYEAGKEKKLTLNAGEDVVRSTHGRM